MNARKIIEAGKKSPDDDLDARLDTAISKIETVPVTVHAVYSRTLEVQMPSRCIADEDELQNFIYKVLDSRQFRLVELDRVEASISDADDEELISI